MNINTYFQLTKPKIALLLMISTVAGMMGAWGGNGAIPLAINFDRWIPLRRRCFIYELLLRQRSGLSYETNAKQASSIWETEAS